MLVRAHVDDGSGEPTGVQFGHALAGAGDQDRDGVPDYAIGVPGSHGAGEVRLHSGATGARLHTFEAPPGTARSFGFAVSALDDLTGEGLPELAIGAPFAGSSRPGKVSVQSFDPFLFGDVASVSAAAGGALTLDLDFPASQALSDYVVLASEGRGPSEWRGLWIPLTQGALFGLTDAGAWPFAVSGTTGTLDGAGSGGATVTFAPSDLDPWVGRELFFAAVTLDASSQGASSSAFVRLVVGP